MISKVYTIGVYGKSAGAFFDTLSQAQIDVFCDIRRRRGVRGSLYSFVNSAQLQRRLHEAGIGYQHVVALAPTDAIRAAQKNDDKRLNEQKRTRECLGEAFKNAYKRDILDQFDLSGFLESFDERIKRIALFCVEGAPLACHRSLVADRIHSEFRIPVENL